MKEPRVLQIVESAAAGVGRHVCDLTAALLEREVSVHVVHSCEHTDRTFEARTAELKQMPGCRVVGLSMSHSPAWSDIANIRFLRSYVRSTGPFLAMHCHSTKAGLLGRMAAIGLRIPTVYTPHAPMSMSPTLNGVTRKMAATYERVLSYSGGAVIAVSDDESRHLQEIGVHRSHIHLAPNGISRSQLPIEPQRSELRRKWGIPADSMCLGFVGRISSQKDIPTLLRAFQLLRHRHGERVRLVIVGDGQMRSELTVKARTLGLQDSVTWAGEMHGQSAMTAFDLFVLSSSYEGLPYVLLEAMASGLPVLSTDVGGARQLIQDGVNGWVVPTRDPEALAEAAEFLLAYPELQKRMGNASLLRVQDFSIDRMVQAILAVYRSIQHVREVHMEARF